MMPAHCGSCELDTAGKHEWKCPMHPRHNLGTLNRKYKYTIPECPNCEMRQTILTTLRRELKEAKAEHQDAELSDAFDMLRREHQTALACCNAFLDAPIDRHVLMHMTAREVLTRDHIKRLALNATGREK